MARRFQNWLVAYMSFTQHSEAPDPLHFWTGVATIAGALRRRVWIEESIFQIVPNFYIIFVAPPGIATKSTTVDLGMRLLRRVDGVHFGPNSLTWQGLTVAMEEAREAVQFGDDRILQMSCLTIPVTELGTLLKTRDDDLLQVLTDIWDGRQTEWKHRIKNPQPGQNAETRIVNPWMNIIGCTTPAWMRKNFPSYIIEGGLTSRCIFVSAIAKRKLVALPHKHIDHQRFLFEGDALVDELNHIATLCGEFHLSAEAEAWMEHWYEKHWGRAATEGIGDRYSGYMSRKQGHIWKLGMIISAAQRDTREITLEDVETANRCITSLEAETNRMFAHIGATDNAKQTTDILAFLRQTGPVRYTELVRTFLPFMTHRDIEAAIKALLAAGHLVQTENDRKELFFIPFGHDSETKRIVQ